MMSEYDGDGDEDVGWFGFLEKADTKQRRRCRHAATAGCVRMRWLQDLKVEQQHREKGSAIRFLLNH